MRMLYALLPCGWLCAVANLDAQSATTAIGIAAAPDQYVQRGAARLRYHERGSGDPVILIHGYGNDLTVWAGVGDSLAQDHRVVALDLRGFGRSTKSSRPAEYGLNLANDVIAVANTLQIGRFHVVGYSMGALVAANLAARYPRRVASASLIAGPFYADSEATARAFAPVGADLEAGRGLTGIIQFLFAGLDSATVKQMSDGLMTQNDVGSLIAVQSSLGALAPALQQSPPMPLLIAVGDADPLESYSRALATRWSRAHFLIMPGANHGTALSQRALLGALREVMQSKDGRP